MKITRSFAAQSLRLAFSALLGFSAIPASAAPGNRESNATIISFSANDRLKAETAADILADRLKLRSGIDAFQTVYTERPGGGLEVQRFSQYFKGLRVAHGTYTVTSKNGFAAYAFGKFFELDAATSASATISEAEALSKALGATGANVYMWDIDKTVASPKGELQFVEDFSWGEPDGSPHLAYVFDIYAAEPLSRENIYVDAQSGKILLRDAIIKHVAAKGKSLYSDTVGFEAMAVSGGFTLHDNTRSATINTYNFNGNTYSGGGTPANLSSYDVLSPTTIFPTTPAVDAQWGATKVFDYWKSAHNRNSWNGTNGALNSFVNYGSGYNNAFWNGSAMFYGNGTGAINGGLDPLTSLDVCSHEIGHGICSSTAALVYQGESGGMNEGFSDIWGAVVENFGNPNEVDVMPKNIWLIGEELGSTFRSMSNPNAFRQPDTYQGQSWIYTGPNCDNSNDKCGVHTNSGVLNYWFYLLTVGGKGNNDFGNPFHVTSIGMANAAKIAYATELALTSTSNFAACRAASIAAASTIFGACSKEVESVVRAWYAVGVGANYAACAPQVSFSAHDLGVDENAGIDACAPSRTIQLPVVLNGPAPIGGNAVVTLVPFGGTAIAGVDYTIPTNTVTFTAGVAGSQSVNILVYDNGSLGPNKYIDFALSVAANGSNLTAAQVLDTIRVTISSDDRAPQTGSTSTLSVGSSTVVANASSPFLGGYAAGRGQYIYSAAELSASGIKAGVPITAASFTVTLKGTNPTHAYNNYTMKLGHTSQINFINSNFIDLTTLSSPPVTVYSSNYSTSVGANTLSFSTPFVWDGVSSILIEVCFTNTASGGGNDRVQAGASGSGAATAFSNSSGATGCNLVLSGANVAYNRPMIRFTQATAPAAIANNINNSRNWNIQKNQTVYFYTQPGYEAIAGILVPDTALGCVTAKVTAAGNGFVTASGGQQRSVKEFQLSSTQSVAGRSFDVVLYLSDAELAGKDPYTLSIVQTTSASDDNLLPSNTSIVSPNDIIVGANWTGFRGNFRDIGRFYLSTGQLALGVGGTKGAINELWTGSNPFQSAPVLHWNLGKSERVSIRMTDITGKLIYSIERSLDAGVHQAELGLNGSIAPGTYVLQVVRPGGVFTRQLVKR